MYVYIYIYIYIFWIQYTDNILYAWSWFLIISVWYCKKRKSVYIRNKTHHENLAAHLKEIRKYMKK